MMQFKKILKNTFKELNNFEKHGEITKLYSNIHDIIK